MSRKSSFPLLLSHPEICYLDSAATTHKPASVIEAVDHYLRHDLATIHRGVYGLALRSEDRYRMSKEVLAQSMGVFPHEIVYTAHSTAASNLLAWSVAASLDWPAWSVIMLSVTEHHAIVVPWQQLAARHGWHIERIGLDESYDISLLELQEKCHSGVKALICSAVSNVTGKIHSLSLLWGWLKATFPDVLFVVDASQYLPHAIPHIPDWLCDAMFFTGHKIWALTGIGVLWMSEHLGHTLRPQYWWGGAVEQVWLTTTTLASFPDSFEPGSPHMVGVISLMAAWEFLQEIHRDNALDTHEQGLKHLFLEETRVLREAWFMSLLWWSLDPYKDLGSHIGLFSRTMPASYNPHIVWQMLAHEGVALRVWAHCAHPLHEYAWRERSCRVSFWASTDEYDVVFFARLMRKYFGL
jgi:cysteine desulfurase / selenocysteine lyase